MPSAALHPEVVSDYLDKELALGRMLGPFPLSHAPSCHISRFGVIPKGHNTGKWRLITDLSFPHGRSVNDGIDPDLCSLSYITVDAVADRIRQLGVGTMMAKVDIESAYRLIPVHPDDRPLQAVQWEGKLFVDSRLPFGLRSAPKIFNAVADALCWHLVMCGVEWVLHYLDDYIVLGAPDSPECQEALATLIRVCGILGVPLATHKTEGPTTCLTYLGIEVDSVAGELRLPVEKLLRLRQLLQAWGDRKSCSRKDLESLVGHLNHACKVVRPGRSFLRRILDLLHGTQRHPSRSDAIRLNTEFRADLAWWQEFVVTWNGTSFLTGPAHLPTVEMASDASGSWGCGAWCGNMWFQVQWDHRSQDLPIAVKELLPIVLACAIWGRGWQGHQVLCHCDNQAVVATLRSRSSKHKGLMHLLRCLTFLEAGFGCSLRATYINTKANHLADDLSRNELPSFLSKVPLAHPSPSQLPDNLLNLLLNPRADWISPLWRHQFNDIFKAA